MLTVLTNIDAGVTSFFSETVLRAGKTESFIDGGVVVNSCHLDPLVVPVLVLWRENERSMWGEEWKKLVASLMLAIIKNLRSLLMRKLKGHLWTLWAVYGEKKEQNPRDSLLPTHSSVQTYFLKLLWMVSSMHSNYQYVSVHSSFSSAFTCRNVIFIELVCSARLYMKIALWGFYVWVFDFSGEPASCPGDVLVHVPVVSRTEFETGRATTCDEMPNAPRGPPMELVSSV